MAAGNYWMSQLNLEISLGQVVWPRVVLVLGLSICFAPVNVAAYLYTPPLLRGAAVGLLSLLRNEGGSVGTSLAQTMQERRDQFHILRLGKSLDPFNPAVASFLEQARGVFLQQTGDPVAAQQLAWQALENLRQQQASAEAPIPDAVPTRPCARLKRSVPFVKSAMTSAVKTPTTAPLIPSSD